MISQAQTQNTIKITGTVYDYNNKTGIPGHAVNLFTDSIYDPVTSTIWSYQTKGITDSAGYYSFTVTIPYSITKAAIYVETECNNVISLLSINYPSLKYDYNDFYCGGQTNTCMAGFTYKPDYLNKLKYYFFDYSYGKISSWQWSFGDGSSSNIQNPAHTYTKDGIYLVSLSISDTVNNCTDSIAMYLDTRDTFINPGCKAYFYYYPDNKDSFTIYFVTDSSNTSSVFTWSLGDNTSATGNFVKHTYSTKGKYLVCVTMYDSVLNCSDTFCETIEIPFKTPCYSYFYYDVNGDTVTFYADKNNYKNAKFIWNFGDGTGDIDTALIKKHVYTKKSTYEVCLTVVTSTDSCYEYCDYVSTDSSFNYKGFIGGMVLLNNTYADYATIYLISYNEKDSTISAIDSTSADSGGYYMFNNLPSGSYYLKAALKSNSQYYKDYLPTYYDTTIYWSNAVEEIIYPNGFPVYADIHMIKGSNPGGPGFIGGKVTKGSNYRSDNFPGIPVILFDAYGKAVAYTYSDEYGNFEFKNLALGGYKVYADHFGINCQQLSVKLTESNKSVSNVQIVVNNDGIKVSVEDLLDNLVESAGNLFPNPVDKSINLNILTLKNVEAEITIINILGKKVYSETINLVQGQNTISLQADMLEKGVYLMNLNIEGKGQLNYRFVK